MRFAFAHSNSAGRWCTLLFITFFFSKAILASGTHNEHPEGQYSPTKSLNFLPNAGQWTNNEILYRSSINGLYIYFTKTDIKYVPRTIADGKWQVSFVNASAQLNVSASDILPTKWNYFSGRTRHFTNIQGYKRLTYNNLYDHINLEYYHKNGKLKFDYILEPGANIKDIQLSYTGVESVSINNQDQLVIQAKDGTLIEELPYAFQLYHGLEREVKVKYTLNNNSSVGFSIVGNYDPKLPLIIDPVIMEWSTYVGSTSGLPFDDRTWLHDVAVDQSGNVYSTGYATGDFSVTAGAYDELGDTLSYDVYVFKLDPKGENLIYGTYISGSIQEYGNAIDVNDLGEAFVVGYTMSPDFPRTPKCI